MNLGSPLNLNLVLNLDPPSAFPGSWPVSRSVSNRRLSMNLPESSSCLRLPIRESQRDSVPKPGVGPRRGPTPGGRFREFTTPSGLRTAGATPLGLAPMHDLPGVARASHPRALGRNPFGIECHRCSLPGSWSVGRSISNRPHPMNLGSPLNLTLDRNLNPPSASSRRRLRFIVPRHSQILETLPLPQP